MELPPCKQPKLTSNATSKSYEFFNLSVQLYCTKTSLIDKGEIKFESPPQDVLDVKKQVEKQFSIPVCVQTVSYNGDTLNNHIKLSDLKVRNGDTFYVKYLAKGICTDLINIISWLEQLSSAIACCTDLNDTAAIQRKMIESLRNVFSQCSDPTSIASSRSYVTKLFFAHNDGVGMMLKVYKLLLQKTWNDLDQRLKLLECYIIALQWWFAETFPLRRLLIQHNVIPMVTQSLLRVRLEEGKRIQEFDTSRDQYQQDLLIANISRSIGVFLK